MKIAQNTASTVVPATHGKPYLKSYPKGVSGNPSGRPMGSRQKLTEGFINDLSKYYEIEGANLIKRVGEENPAILLQVIVRLMPKDVNLNVSSDVTSQITDEQKQRIAEAWLMTQSPSVKTLEGEAVRIETAALTSPDDDQDDVNLNQSVIPDREIEAVKVGMDDDVFESNQPRKRQTRPVHSRIIGSGAQRS